MRIALVYNLRVGDDEATAEFDTPDTIAALTQALSALGHEVHGVEASGPVSALSARLEALRPDLIVNTAEGSHGRYREAFFPALFEQLGLAWTGSDAYVCAVTLDKQATKRTVAAAGVPTPGWRFVEEPIDAAPPELRLPVIVKPNFEGSSKGITADSVVRDPERLPAVVNALLARYPTGVLIEEFIVGTDITVPWLEAVEGAVLEPAAYDYGETEAAPGYAIYDYALKNDLDDQVTVTAPAPIAPELRAQLIEHTRRVMQTLGVRDLGRVDFRVTADGEPYFIEVNALPSLQPGASIYLCAALIGLDTVEAVLGAVIESATRRHPAPPPAPDEAPLRVGITYNLKRVAGEAEAEFDSPETIAALRGALESLGHEVVELEARPELMSALPNAKLDLVFNIAEGFRGRNREAQIPAMLELFGVPYTGSDPATLAVTLDKGLAKRLIRQAGLNTPDFAVLTRADAPLPDTFTFPLLVKPNAEGSSKGIGRTSVVHDEAGLRAQVKALLAAGTPSVLVEAFLPGREFTVALLGDHDAPRLLPPMEIVFSPEAGPTPVYSFEHKLETDRSVHYQVPAEVSDELLAAIQEAALGAFLALGCRDVARIDLRLDAAGAVHFIECNPLPGITPGYSDLCKIASAEGLSYPDLIAAIIAPALARRAATGEAP